MKISCGSMAIHCEICPCYNKCWIENIDPYKYDTAYLEKGCPEKDDNEEK